MRGEVSYQELRQREELDVAEVASRLDRVDVLLLRRFYVTGRPGIHDTEPHVLRVLVDTVHRSGSLAERRLSYSAIRRRLDHLVELGLLGKIHRTNPKIYEPIEHLARDVRRVILHFAAEVVGLKNAGGGT